MPSDNSAMRFIRKYPLEILFIAGLIVFVLYKISDIGVPYFWDEAGVYVAGARQMNDFGHIGMLPNDLDPLLSRGHPLLFYFCEALIFRNFGDTVISGHIFALLLALTTLIVFYFFARKEFDPLVATLSTVLLSVQPIFFSLSAMLVPEMMLTLFTLISLWGIIRNNWILYAIGASLALLTKESAIVIPALGLTIIFFSGLINRDLFTLKRLKLMMIGLIPVLVFGLFLIIQKIQRGWFFFPEHIGYIHFDIQTLKKMGGRILYDMLFDQGRWLIGYPFLAGLFFCILAKPLKMEFNTKPFLVFIGFLLLVLIFADINYYLTRYILNAIPFIVLGGVYTAVTIFRRISQHKRAIFAVLIILFTSGAIISAQQNMTKFPYGCDMSYKWVVNTSEEAIHWIGQQPWRNDTINANFPINEGLKDERNGYLSGEAIPFVPGLEKVRNYALFFYEWGPENIAIPKEIRYKILKTWSKSFANVAAIQFVKLDTTPGVTGIGGIFFKSENPQATKEWYGRNLGLAINKYGSSFEFRNADRPGEINYLHWSPLEQRTKYFNPSQKEFMINYRVKNIEGLVKNLKKNGVTILDTIQHFKYGKFIHIMDNDGNKIELWEPVDSIFTKMGGKTTK